MTKTTKINCPKCGHEFNVEDVLAQQIEEKHRDCESQLRTWYHDAERADWKSPEDVKRQHVTASILGDNRVVFNIKGNKYRLVVKFNYGYRRGWIRFIGTHEEYDDIDAESI